MSPFRQIGFSGIISSSNQRMDVRSIKQVKNLKDKCVLVRVDFNVPLENGRVVDDFKIKKSLPTIEYLLRQGARVVLVSHLGRPQGVEKKLSLKSVAEILFKALGRQVNVFSAENQGAYLERAQEAIAKLSPGEAILLENIRFFPEEEKNDLSFAQQLSALADLFVLDGFAVAHRSAASVSGVAKFLPTYAGLLLEEEIKGLSKVVDQPAKPLVVVLGGAKMETKIPVIKNFLSKADHILLGGGIVNTYLWAKGYEVGKSLRDEEYKAEALAYGAKKKIVMPVDVVVGKEDGKLARSVAVDKGFGVKKGEGIYDVGPLTIRLYAQYIKEAQTVIWNGALGYFEQPPYQFGTNSIARLIAARAKGKAFGVCGGGETVEVLRDLKLMQDIDLVSTGGGAMLEFLSGEKLSGVEAVKA